MCDLYSHDSHFWSIIVSKQNSAHEWTVASAKAHLSEVISRAQQSPQTITRNGKASVVIVSIEEWQHKSGAGLELEGDNARGGDLPL